MATAWEQWMEEMLTRKFRQFQRPATELNLIPETDRSVLEFTPRIIEKKLWPDYFDADRTAPLDCKLADFELRDGDIVRFREWDPATAQYTGRSYDRTVKTVLRQESPTRYWTPEQLKEHGLYLIIWRE